jgi:hypothetical protein
LHSSQQGIPFTKSQARLMFAIAKVCLDPPRDKDIFDAITEALGTTSRQATRERMRAFARDKGVAFSLVTGFNLNDLNLGDNDDDDDDDDDAAEDGENDDADDGAEEDDGAENGGAEHGGAEHDDAEDDGAAEDDGTEIDEAKDGGHGAGEYQGGNGNAYNTDPRPELFINANEIADSTSNRVSGVAMNLGGDNGNENIVGKTANLAISESHDSVEVSDKDSSSGSESPYVIEPASPMTFPATLDPGQDDSSDAGDSDGAPAAEADPMQNLAMVADLGDYRLAVSGKFRDLTISDLLQMGLDMIPRAEEPAGAGTSSLKAATPTAAGSGCGQQVWSPPAPEVTGETSGPRSRKKASGRTFLGFNPANNPAGAYCFLGKHAAIACRFCRDEGMTLEERIESVEKGHYRNYLWRM